MWMCFIRIYVKDMIETSDRSTSDYKQTKDHSFWSFSTGIIHVRYIN
jgi:hypothetical protein